MTKERLAVDYKRIKELARCYFDRMCPKAGSKEQIQDQEKILLKIIECFDELLCPKVACTTFEGGSFEPGVLCFENDRIDCPGLFPADNCPDIKYVMAYGISLPEIKPKESMDLLEIFLLDCWMTALLDGTRDWLKEDLEDKISDSDAQVSHGFGPGFFGINMDVIPEILKRIDADSLGLKMFYGSLYPPKSNVGFYLVYKAGKEWESLDCQNCLSGGKNCLFCKNHKSNI